MSSPAKNEELESNPSESGGFWQQNRGRIGLGLLMAYVFLLGLGTVGELWEIEWILDLPLFRPPGKY